MSAFIEQADYLPYIKDTRLLQMLEQNTTILDDAEETAQAVVNDALYSRYNVQRIFLYTGADRPKQVVRWCVMLVLYYLHQRLPDRLMPERLGKDYDDTLQVLSEIEDGKKATNLPLLPPPDGHAQISKFKWGSNAPRPH
jgi:Protein of unknown function (DUF1320)